MKIYSSRRNRTDGEIFDQIVGKDIYALIKYIEGFSSDYMWVHLLERYLDLDTICYEGEVIYVYSQDFYKHRMHSDRMRLVQDHMKLVNSVEFMTTSELYKALKWK